LRFQDRGLELEAPHGTSSAIFASGISKGPTYKDAKTPEIVAKYFKIIFAPWEPILKAGERV